MSSKKPPSISTDKPDADALEVSLFGPGYGECVAVHLGSGSWMIVDSCIDSRSRAQPALEYLAKLGVDTASEVRLVVATHWHDDHVRGLARVVADCEAADFVASGAVKENECLQLIAAADAPSVRRTSGLRELREVMERLVVRQGYIKTRWCIANRRLLHLSAGVGCDVWSLSPSDAAFTASLQSFARLLPAVNSGRRADHRSPNHLAVVLYVRVGDHVALLGSDLETALRGWEVILDSNERPSQEADIYKVAHHGSENADHPRIWPELLGSDPIAVLTPFRQGGVRLPTEAMAAALRGRGGSSFITAEPDPKLPARLPPATASAMRMTGVKLSEVHGLMGHVQVRVSGAGVDVRWSPPARRL